MQKIIKYIYKTGLTILIIFCSFLTKAQNTDSVRIAINNILAPLNKSLIPTSILAENIIYINHSPPTHNFFFSNLKRYKNL